MPNLFRKRRLAETNAEYKPDRRRPFIDVEADYGAGPIWLCRKQDDIRQPVDPSTLPISKKLVDDFKEWQTEFDEPLKQPDYNWSGSRNFAPNFWARGKELTERLSQELGTDYDVRYSHDNKLVKEKA